MGANQWLQDWARGRRGGTGKKTKHESLTNQEQKRPDWLGPRLGVSEAIEGAGKEEWSQAEEIRLISALAMIPADLGYDDWFRYGMALHDWHELRGLEIYDRWSSQSEKYPGREAIERKWVSFGRPYDGLRCTVASIYADARARGWVEPSSVISNVNGVEALPPELTEEKDDKKLILLNQKHAVINNIGNKPVVLDFVQSPIKGVGLVPTFVTFKSFEDRYCNQYMALTTKTKNKKGEEVEKTEIREIGRQWLHWHKRQTYEGIGLSPTGDLPPHYFNLWQGWPYEAKQGDWGRMKAHIQNVIGNGRQNQTDYAVKWTAWALQHPGELPGAALVLRGDEGVGKGLFATTVQSMFGAHGLHIHNAKHMLGFNAMLRNCLLLYADEAFWAGDRQGESTLKGLITDPTLTIEQKGIDATPWPNRIHMIMAANAEWVVPARHDARRYGMLDVSSCKARDKIYFDALVDELDHGGREAMLYDMLHLDLEGWHPRQIPNTEALREQKALSMDWRDQWWASLLERGSLPFRVHFINDDQSLKEVASAKILMAHAADYATNARNYNPTVLGRYLGEKGKKCHKHHTKFGEMWQFPALGHFRTLWEKEWGGWKWNLDLTEWGEKTDW